MPTSTRRIQNIEGANQVHLKIQTGIVNRGGYRCLRGKVIDFRGLGHRFFHHADISNVGDGNLQTSRAGCHLSEPFQVMVDSGAREIVENVYLGVCAGEQMMREIGANESSSSKNEHRARL